MSMGALHCDALLTMRPLRGPAVHLIARFTVLPDFFHTMRASVTACSVISQYLMTECETAESPRWQAEWSL